MNLFRELSFKEEFEFRLWARDNFQPLSEISEGWHPVIRDECRKINSEVIDNIMAGNGSPGR